MTYYGDNQVAGKKTKYGMENIMDRQNNVLEYLDHIVTVYPDKNAYIDEKEAYTFSRVYEEAGRLGTRLLKDGFYKEPIVVFMRKQSCTIAAFFGIVSAGCYRITSYNVCYTKLLRSSRSSGAAGRSPTTVRRS